VHRQHSARLGSADRDWSGEAVTAAAAETALTRLRERIAAFDDVARAYLSHPNPGEKPRFADYAQLARVSEWLTAAEDDGD